MLILCIYFGATNTIQNHCRSNLQVHTLFDKIRYIFANVFSRCTVIASNEHFIKRRKTTKLQCAANEDHRDLWWL